MTVDQRKKLPAGPVTKVLGVRTKAAEPTDAQVAMINRMTLREFSRDELYIRQMMLANDQTDRSGERFDAGYLDRFNKTGVGKSVLMGHEHAGASVARFFDSEITRDPQGWQWVAPSFYMPVSPGNQLDRDNIDAGVWSYVSIGCYVDNKGLTCDICGQPYYYWLQPSDSQGAQCPHIKGETYEGKACTCTWDSSKSDMSQVEMVEGSIVYLGCQYEAAISKSAAESHDRDELKIKLLRESDTTKPTGNPGGELEASMTLEELTARNKELEPEAAKVPGLESKIKELEGSAAVGVKLMDGMRTEIKRLAGCLGIPEVIVSTIDGVTDGDKLIELKDTYEKEWAEKRGVKPQSEAETQTTETVPAGRANADRDFAVL